MLAFYLPYCLVSQKSFSSQPEILHFPALLKWVRYHRSREPGDCLVFMPWLYDEAVLVTVTRQISFSPLYATWSMRLDLNGVPKWKMTLAPWGGGLRRGGGLRLGVDLENVCTGRSYMLEMTHVKYVCHWTTCQYCLFLRELDTRQFGWAQSNPQASSFGKKTEVVFWTWLSLF